MREAARGKRRAGPLVIVGGAEDRQGESVILREFVRLAGGARAVVLVMSAASTAPAEIASLYIETFTRLGVREVRALDIATRSDANRAEALAAIERASGVFFTGGNQLRITRLLGGTQTDRMLHRRQAEGMVLAGTSAGAAMMSGTMIVGGAPVTTPRLGIVELAPGMDFLPGVLIDQHFEQRGRMRRLLSAVALHPHDLGLGVDEDTAAVVRGHLLEVLGTGSVTIIDAGGMTHTNLHLLERNERLAICGAKIHILPPGYRFDLDARTPLFEEEHVA